MNLDNPIVQETISFLRNHRKFQAEDWFKLTDSDMSNESWCLLGMLLVSKGELNFAAVKRHGLVYALQFYKGADHFTIGVCDATSSTSLTIPTIKLLHNLLSRSGTLEDPTSLMFKKEITEKLVKEE